MNDRQRIEFAKEADRDALAMILVRNGYAVKRCREKRGKSSDYTYFIEYWRE